MEMRYKKESRLRDSPPAAGRNMRHVSYPPQCDPHGVFLCNGNEVSYYIKNRLKLLLETVIKSYYRGTTHLDHPVHSLMYYHTRLIDNGFGSR